MREVYATMGESIYPNLSSLSMGLPGGIWETTQEPQRVYVSRYGELIGTMMREPVLYSY